MHKLTILVYVCALAACKLTNPVPVEPDYPSTDDAGSSSCARACLNFERLGCPEARHTDTGISCTDVCLRSSALVKHPLTCWVKAKTVDELRACGGVRCVP